MTSSLLGLIFNIVIGVSKEQEGYREVASAAVTDDGKIGVEVIRASVSILPGQPGVYRMLDPNGSALDVG